MGQTVSAEDRTRSHPRSRPRSPIDVEAMSFYYDESYDSPEAFAVATDAQMWWSQQKDWPDVSSDGGQHPDQPADDLDVESGKQRRVCPEFPPHMDKARRRLFDSGDDSLPHSPLAPQGRHPLALPPQTCPLGPTTASEAPGRRVRCKSRYLPKHRPIHGSTDSPFVSKMLELAREAKMVDDGMPVDTVVISIA
eukprot:m.112411 g.112411  ORF g.112411 m.112411 type:complete len:194 (-) comp21421_c0_seq1:62-643(-)